MLAVASSSLAVIVSLASHCSSAPASIGLAFVGDGASRIASGVLTEARRVWSSYGVPIGRVGGGESFGVMVHVRTSDAVSGAAPDGRALGSIEFHDGVPDPDVVLYPARAWTFICQTVGVEANSWPAAYRALVLDRVLGRALAHELGHYLLQTRMHSQNGLMRATQSIADLMSPDPSLVLLAGADVARLTRRNNCAAPDISPGGNDRFSGADK